MHNILYLDKKKLPNYLIKKVFKVVTSKDILSNNLIFNFYFINKIKNLAINKTFKKN